MKAEATLSHCYENLSHLNHLLDEYVKLVAQIPGAQLPEIHSSPGRFLQLPVDQRDPIMSAFEDNLSNLRTLLEAIGANKGSRKFDLEAEKISLKNLLNKKSLKLSDEGFWDVLADGDIIEVYDGQGKQLYRSWSCYQYLSYSFLDLMLYDFDTLFDRPAWVAQKLWEMLPSLFVPGAKTMPYNLPDYVLRERMPSDAWTLLFKMKFASPLLSKETGEPVAFVSTGHMTPLGKASQTSGLTIL